jgi:hypothetical protein
MILAESKKLLTFHQFLYFLSFVLSLNFDISKKKILHNLTFSKII